MSAWISHVCTIAVNCVLQEQEEPLPHLSCFKKGFLKIVVISIMNPLWKETAMIKLKFMEKGYSHHPSTSPRSLKRTSSWVSSAQWVIHYPSKYT